MECTLDEEGEDVHLEDDHAEKAGEGIVGVFSDAVVVVQ